MTDTESYALALLRASAAALAAVLSNPLTERTAGGAVGFELARVDADGDANDD